MQIFWIGCFCNIKIYIVYCSNLLEKKMKGWILLMVILSACQAKDNQAKSEIYAAQIEGRGAKIGEVLFTDTPQGLLVEVDLQNLPSGEHGFHIHENASCAAAADKSGNMQPALAAGGHFDPLHTKQHLGPDGHGHLGDLPALNVLADGTVKTSFYMPNLTAEKIKNRATVIHAGGDNYSDQPQPLGGGGERIACGIIQ